MHDGDENDVQLRTGDFLYSSLNVLLLSMLCEICVREHVIDVVCAHCTSSRA